MYMLGPFIGPDVDFQNQWLNLKKKKLNFQNDRKISQPNKNQTIYCNFGLMHRKAHKYIGK